MQNNFRTLPYSVISVPLRPFLCVKNKPTLQKLMATREHREPKEKSSSPTFVFLAFS